MMEARLLLGFLVFVTLYHLGDSCSCLPTTIKKKYCDADFAAKVRVTSNKKNPSGQQDFNDFYRIRRIGRAAWKGFRNKIGKGQPTVKSLAESLLVAKPCQYWFKHLKGFSQTENSRVYCQQWSNVWGKPAERKKVSSCRQNGRKEIENRPLFVSVYTDTTTTDNKTTEEIPTIVLPFVCRKQVYIQTKRKIVELFYSSNMLYL